MAYISRMIANGETLIGVSRLHWIYLAQGLCWLIGLMFVGFVIDALLAMALGAILPIPAVQWGFMAVQTTWIEMFFIAAGLYLFAIYFIKVATTELALTNQRIIYKLGWIFVNVQEMNLDEIRGTHIDLGMLGRFLGYGSISFDARFVGDMVTGSINRPYRFLKAMNEAQAEIDNNISLVIDNVKGEKLHIRQPGEGGQISRGHKPTPDPEPEDNPPPKKQTKEDKGGQGDAQAQQEKDESPGTEPTQFEDPPMLTPEHVRAALQGETVTVPLAPGTEFPVKAGIKKASDKKDKEPEADDIAPIDPDNRPAAAPHAVAEGSYEEEKLKEELLEEFSQTISPDDENSSTRQVSRRIH